MRVEAGESPEVVMKALGLTRPRIYEWRAKCREGGIEALRMPKSPGNLSSRAIVTMTRFNKLKLKNISQFPPPRNLVTICYRNEVDLIYLFI